MFDPALLIGRPVYACPRGHEQHQPGPCLGTVQRGHWAAACSRPTTLARHEPSALALALAMRDELLKEYAVADAAGRAAIEQRLQRAEQRLIEAATEAGLTWDEARKL